MSLPLSSVAMKHLEESTSECPDNVVTHARGTSRTAPGRSEPPARRNRSAGEPKPPVHRHEPPVLVVDDDHDWRDLTQRLLKKEGISNPVVSVGSADEAKAYLRTCCPSAGGRRSSKPAVVLLDIHMPPQSGFDVLRWIKGRKAFRRTKVIMWSSSEDDRDRQRAGELKADAYLVKFTMGAIIAAAVRACMAQRATDRSGSSNDAVAVATAAA